MSDEGIKKILSLYMEPEVYRKLRVYAKVENRSLNNLIGMILKEYIAKKEDINIGTK